ncbi:MAG: rod-binding protein [bacterium]|nr:rod-binding protein [bacterium]
MDKVTLVLDSSFLKSNTYLGNTKSVQNNDFLERIEKLNLEKGTPLDGEKKKKKLKELSKEFESIFVNQMIKTMRATVGKENLCYGGMAEDVFQEMLDQEYAKSMSSGKDFGMAKAVYDQLSKHL